MTAALAQQFPNLTQAQALEYLVPAVSYEALDEEGKLASRREFVALVLSFYQEHGRQFAWRDTFDTWPVLLSEVMLQQTQTSRVAPKYEEFLAQWPTWQAMATSALDEVLYRWKGMGYPKRALAIRNISKATEQWDWTLPDDYDQLLALPGIGPSTAAAIQAFCYNTPCIYLETNVRRVLLHHFFPQQEKVHDKVLKALLSQLLEEIEDVKSWYYAMMDYGVLLKFLVPNSNRRSAHYSRQGKFEDSNRQIRGLVLLQLGERGALQRTQLLDALSQFEPERIDLCLETLCKDGLVELTGEPKPRYRIPRQ